MARRYEGRGSTFKLSFFCIEFLRQILFAIAKEHHHWIKAHWRKIIWLDKSTFEIEKRLQRVKVWGHHGEQYSLDCLASTFKLGHTLVMVLGAFIRVALLDSTSYMMILIAFFSWNMVLWCTKGLQQRIGDKLIT